MLVNGERARASRSLLREDTVEIRFPGEREALRPLTPHHCPVGIVYEDDDILVIDKPAGLVVHPAPGHWDDTLVNVLVARGTQLSRGSGRPGIVHRLDKDTSGLIIVAKTDAAHRALSLSLSRRRLHREYAVLVWGHLAGSREIDAPLARHPKDRKRMAVLATGRSALTRVEPVARFDVCDLVRATLASGRTHQIRVHLAHIGHPVVGDAVYHGGGARRMTGSQRVRANEVERMAPRQALHAAALRFVHPVSGEQCDLHSEWPSDLRPLLAAAAVDETLLDRPNPLEYLGFPSP